jgi:FtsH-binding integral membrane protein
MVNSNLYNRFFGKTSSMKGGGKFDSLISLMNEKKGFLVLVFSNLIAQLGITYWVMERTKPEDVKLLPVALGQIITILVIAFVPMPTFIKTLLFCLFSYLSGLMLSGFKKMYSPDLIKTALQGTLSVFGVMLATGIALLAGGIKLGKKFGAMLFFALLLLIITRLIFLLSNKLEPANKVFSFIGIILFAIYILYDTNIILQRNYYGDFITASLDYYLDIINLFTNLLFSSED